MNQRIDAEVEQRRYEHARYGRTGRRIKPQEKIIGAGAGSNTEEGCPVERRSGTVLFEKKVIGKDNRKHRCENRSDRIQKALVLPHGKENCRHSANSRHCQNQKPLRRLGCEVQRGHHSGIHIQVGCGHSSQHNDDKSCCPKAQLENHTGDALSIGEQHSCEADDVHQRAAEKVAEEAAGDGAGFAVRVHGVV